MKTPFAEALRERPLVFDGAMGTELYRRNQFVNVSFEELCLKNPALVRAIHRENREAGADVLTTNSFAANRFKLAEFLLADQVGRIARAAAELARSCADESGGELYVAGSVGPLGRPVGPGGVAEEEALEAFREAIAALREGGVDFIIFETFSRRRELELAVQAAAALDAPYIPSMAFSDRNLTRSGERMEDFFAPFPGAPPPLLAGFNCSVGPRQMLEYLQDFIPRAPHRVLVMPNAGYPQFVHDRMIYMTSPEYFASYAARFLELGAAAVGGCCGTGPEHIREAARRIKALRRARAAEMRAEPGAPAPPRGSEPGMPAGPDPAGLPPVRAAARPAAPAAERVPPVPMAQRSRLAAKLAAGEWVTSVEIVPPLGHDLSAVIQKSCRCREAGVDAINIPDGPRASSRVSPLVTAHRIQQACGIETVLHLTCRDRNIIGMQSDLLGCAAAGIANLLIVTGDPPKLGDYPMATAVFDIDSIGLTRIARELNHGLDIGGKPVRPPSAFLLGVGADPTHLDQEREAARLRRKVEAGAEFVITQPVYDPEALLAFLERAGPLGVPVIAGVWPLASLQNARFLQNEVPGVTIPGWVMKRMEAAGDKESARREGIAIAREIVGAIRSRVAGIQVSAPFGNVETALRVLE